MAQSVESTAPKVATFLDFPPYISDEEPDDGVLSAIVKESFALAGVEPEYTLVNWRRSYRAVGIGEIDASFSWAYSPERAAMVLLSEPIFSISNQLLSTYPDLTDWRQLTEPMEGAEKPILCVPVGWKVAVEVQQLIDKDLITQVSPSHPRFCMELVHAGRTNIVYMPRMTAIHFLEKVQNDENDTHKHEMPELYGIEVPSGVANTQHVIFSKTEKGAALRQKFDAGFRQLVSSGRYRSILQRFLNDYPPSEQDAIYQEQIKAGILPAE